MVNESNELREVRLSTERSNLMSSVIYIIVTERVSLYRWNKMELFILYNPSSIVHIRVLYKESAIFIFLSNL